MAIKLGLSCTPGHIAVIREHASEYWIRDKDENGNEIVIHKTERDADFQHKTNVYALVVGVGAQEVTQYGTIEQPAAPGDIVAITMCGVTLPLGHDENGEPVEFYVLPFSGVQAVKEWTCDACQFVSRREITVCPNCPKIALPSVADVLRMNRAGL